VLTASCRKWHLKQQHSWTVILARPALSRPIVNPSLTSACRDCRPMCIYVLCSVYGSEDRVYTTFYSQNCTSARVWRCYVTYDQRPWTNYSTEFPYIYPHVQSHSPRAPPCMAVAVHLLWVGPSANVVASPAWLSATYQLGPSCPPTVILLM